MAFLCPVRIGRKKKKDTNQLNAAPSLGRITGSASIETLVRVGIEKENGISDAKMIVLHDFMPCVDDELQVKRGQIVNVLYQENDWVYVIGENNREGFIPHSYCSPVSSQFADMIKHKKPRGEAVLDPIEPLSGQKSVETDNYSTAASDVHPFYKDPAGKYLVLYTFIARDENDVSVERGEFVTVLNKDDPEWYWIARSDGYEGFVPSAFVCSTEVAYGKATAAINGTTIADGPTHLNNETLNNNNTRTANNNNHLLSNSFESSSNSNLESSSVPIGLASEADSSATGQRQGLTELVMLYDFKAEAPDDLNVVRGDWVYTDFGNQTVDGWLWVYCPKLKKFGFIPASYARPPAMTSL